MPKYLAHVSYTVDGLKGLLQDGGTKRREVVVKLAESLGGKLETFYYALGEDDLFAIFEYPDNVSATSASLIVNASGAATV
ncbi:MAG: GYD domain-containing protein, partial [Desulfobacterales bacterium]